jgi:hypothetical protein
MLMVSIT